MSNTTPIYIESHYPPFGYAIGLFTLQCVIVMSVLFCFCCGHSLSSTKINVNDNVTKFKITKYTDVGLLDKEYFKLTVPHKSQVKELSTTSTESTALSASSVPTPVLESSVSVSTSAPVLESSTSVPTSVLESSASESAPIKEEVKKVSSQCCDAQDNETFLNTTTVINKLISITDTTTDTASTTTVDTIGTTTTSLSECGVVVQNEVLVQPVVEPPVTNPPVSENQVNTRNTTIYQSILIFFKMLIRFVSCGRLCKKQSNVVNPLQNNNIDVENNKKKYLLYKFNNLNIDDTMNDPHQFMKCDPYKNLKEFTEIVHSVYEPHDFEILLHISSPGGIAFKFEELYSHLERLKKKGFVITALVDDICASGGYMLASACNKIVASKYAKIGSIGVICSAVNYYELSQKLGISQKTFKTGKYKESFPTGDKYSEEDENRMQELLSETLETFSGMVQKARNLTEEELAVVLSAKVWSGSVALEKKLVDVLSLSVDYLYDLSTTSDIYIVSPELKKKSMFGSLSGLSGISSLSDIASISRCVKVLFDNIELNNSNSQIMNLKLE